LADHIDTFYNSGKKPEDEDDLGWWACYELTFPKSMRAKGFTLVPTKTDENKTGATGLGEFLSGSCDSKIIIALLKIRTEDDHGSKRVKYGYFRWIGPSVGVMVKSRISPATGDIDGNFGLKHLTMDISAQDLDTNVFAPDNLANNLLRVGGGHKPDLFKVGPGQEFSSKHLKNEG